jgi:hypothetical protein
MLCRHCGTEIADKALICYRCGNATTDPVRKPAPIASRRAGLLPLVALVLLVLLGLFLGQAGRTAAAGRGTPLEIAAAICLAVAIFLLVLRILRRRR